MTDPDFDTAVGRLFDAASRLAPEERAAWLETHCGDDTQRRAVERLLGGFDELEGETSRTVDDFRFTGPSTADTLPETIGPYRVLDLLGEGGFGTVHAAEQLEPVRRRVALKILKPGMDTRAVLARFEAERQTIARMDHPGIAVVFDAGTTEAGRPYFAMELVDGPSITAFCDEGGLDLRERLELFAEVCRAVQHAHQKGVIHRDLKPSNVLVTRIDGRPVPKVIDFGIAKATGGDTSEETLTRTGQIVGTPFYMSPEQAGVEGGGVDTRSDVYSLGCVLYELLTGGPPLQQDRKGETGLLELMRRIREEDPVPPSTLGAAGRELDWIAMKALEKDRTRRYQSAGALADDIERYLRDEPVEASPASASYRVRKLVSRHRGKFAVAAILLVSVITGLVGLIHGLVSNNRANRLLVEQTELADASERASNRSAAEADRMVEELGRLSDLRILESLRSELDGLWPAVPERVAPMYDWLARADELAARLPQHRRTLEELAGRAVPGSDPPAFDDPRLAWWHETLARLVAELDAFVSDDPFGPTLASLTTRLEFAETIEERSITDHRAEWVAAIASIADPEQCPQYGALELREQLGLVPIGRDPDSGLWEFWHVQTGTRPTRDGQHRITMSAESGLVFVLVPGGTFWLGAQDVDPAGRNYDPYVSKPSGMPWLWESHNDRAIEVQLSPFFLSKYEMTAGQWARCTGSDPYDYDLLYRGERVTPLHPVGSVTWEEARRQLGRLALTLPTEPQWEYACRAGTDTPWWTGRDPEQLDTAGNVADRTGAEAGQAIARDHDEQLNDGFASTAPVGRFRANPFGLHDVIGNVLEWCLDPPGGYDGARRPGDGKRLWATRSITRPAEEERVSVTRGGAFDVGSRYARSASRGALEKVSKVASVGLRPARSIDP